MSLLLKILSGIGMAALLIVMCLLDAAFGLIITMVIPILACLVISFFIDLKTKNKTEPNQSSEPTLKTPGDSVDV